MTTDLAKITDAGYTNEKIELIKSQVAKDCTNEELALFLYTAKRTGLDPLARQIYAIKRGGKMTIQTGIDGYRVIADRTGKLAGISDPTHTIDDGAKFPATATVTVKRVVTESIVADFTATARWGEYNAGGQMWAKMPFLMLGKCAEALALRKAFPADLSGVYTQEEMMQASNDDSEQREAVYAEVERQKTAYTPQQAHSEKTIFTSTPQILPPELDWHYSKPTGVLICRIVSAVKRTKKAPAKGEYLTIGINGEIEGIKLATYFHVTGQNELLGAVGKVCKFVVSVKGKFLNIDEVREIDGQLLSTPDEPSAEFQARALASILDIGESDLMKQHREWHDGLWPLTLGWLQRMKAEKESNANPITDADIPF